ncbi:MAG: histidine kinase dimerization/phosphoacceptor domain -containing protein [Bacteroidota bacterium]
MRIGFIISVIYLFLFAGEGFSQYTPLDRCVRDSLYRIMPHSGQIQKAEINLEIAQLIWDTLPLKAFRNLQMALQVGIAEKDLALKARARIYMGDYFVKRRNFMWAQEHYLAADMIYNLSKDTLGELNVLAQIGTLNRMLGNYSDARNYFMKGLKLAESTNKPGLTGKFLNYLAANYQSTREFEKAIVLYKNALAVFQRTNDKSAECDVLNNIGSLYLDEDKNELALAHFRDLLKIADTNERGLIGTVYTRIGHVYFKMKDYKRSLEYNRMALQIRRRFRSAVEVNSSLINIGGDFYMMGKTDSGRYYIERGLNMALRNNRQDLVANAYRHQYLYYQSLGDFRLALDYYHKYSAAAAVMEQERTRSNISILETTKQIQSIKASGKKIKTEHELQTLTSEFQEYEITFVKILTRLASVLMIIFLIQFLYTRRVRRDMQKLNERLSDEITEREKTESQTREREQQFRFLSENSIDFIMHMDSQRQCIYSSPASLKVYGYNPEEVLLLSPDALTHHDYLEFTEGKFKEMLATRSSQQFIYQAKKKNGNSFWVESILNPLFDPITGIFKGVVGVTRDIQERKTKEIEIMEGTKQKENLLKEIHHRVKNNFAILVSLINMQMAQTKNQELFQSLTNLQLRIRTMALVHEMLYRSKDFENISFSDYLRSLASVIAGTYNRRDIILSLDADESVMDIEASIPLGLIVNEILSNSYKHAFPDGRSGHIGIAFSTDAETGNYCLVLQDDGIGMPAGIQLHQYKSMGLQVVQILCQQIEGDLNLTCDQGTKFTITYKSTGK